MLLLFSYLSNILVLAKLEMLTILNRFFCLSCDTKSMDGIGYAWGRRVKNSCRSGMSFGTLFVVCLG